MGPKAVVYVLHRRDGSRLNLTKVGSTRISADSRAANYTDGGWTAYFTTEVSAHVRYAIEKEAHSILKEKGFWLDPTTTGGTAQEIFICSPQEAKDAIFLSIQTINKQISDYINYDIAEELIKSNNIIDSLSRELDDIRKISKHQEITNESYKVINEAGRIKKLQERIRLLDGKMAEKDRDISALRAEVARLRVALEGENRHRSRKRGR